MNEKEIEKFKSEVYDLCMGEDESDAQELLVGRYGAEFVDQWIDDCIVPDEEWRQCTEMRVRGLRVRMYYSTNDCIVADVEIGGA